MLVPDAVFSAIDRVVLLPAVNAGAPFLIGIRHTDSDGDAITATVAIGDRNRYRVRRLGFIVQGCAGSELPRCAANAE